MLDNPITQNDPRENILVTPISEPQSTIICEIPIIEQNSSDVCNTKRRVEPAEKKERKANTMTYPEIAAKLKQDGFKKVGPDEWVHQDKKGGYENGTVQRVTLDRLHGELEGYDRSGRVHQGAIDPATGKIYKPAISGRNIRKS